MEQFIPVRKVWLNEIDSTNHYISTLPATERTEGLLVAAHFQREGKGQRGNTWESNAGENLTFSLVLKPTFIKAQQQFLLSKTVAVGICNALGRYLGNVKIKWPNDIYVGNMKIAGVLIENSIQSNQIDQAIVGIGINVNQTVFSDELPNPTSLALETGTTLDLDLLLDSICNSIAEQYGLLQLGQSNEVSSHYSRLLYRKDDLYEYKTMEGELFVARLVDVVDSGELVLETPTGERKQFGFKEIKFL